MVFLIEWSCWSVFSALFVLGSPWKYSHQVCLGWESTPTVTFFNVWTLGWNAEQAATGFASYWHAPIFHPAQGTFTYSEMQPTTLFVAPIVFCFSLCLAYNMYVLMTLGLNGLLMRRLLKLLGQTGPSALFGALAATLLPFCQLQLGVVQLTTIWGPILALMALIRLRREPTAWTGILLGISFSLTYLACHYYGLFLVLLAPCALVYLSRLVRELRFWRSVFCAVIIAVVIVSPFVAAQRTYLSPHFEPRKIETIASLSAFATDYLFAHEGHFIWTEPGRWLGFDVRSHRSIGCGLLTYSLAFLGIGSALRTTTSRSWALTILGVIALSFVYSLGPTFRIGSWSPYISMIKWIPGVSHIRSPYRFGVMVQLGTIIFAACGVSAILARFDSKTTAAVANVPSQQPLQIAHRTRVIRLGVLILTIFALVETWPTRRHWVDVPDATQHQEWIAWLRDETPPGAVVVGIPFASGHRTQDFVETTQWMILGLSHRRRQVDGYSGHFPDSHRAIRSALEEFPDRWSLQLLEFAQADYIVIQDSAIPDPLTSITPLKRDPRAGISIYSLEQIREFIDHEQPSVASTLEFENEDQPNRENGAVATGHQSEIPSAVRYEVFKLQGLRIEPTLQQDHP